MVWDSAAYAPRGAAFHGQGIQNSGRINVGGNVNIGIRGDDTETLLKVRLTDPRDDKKRIEQQKGGLLHGSYKWILSHEDFQKWRDGGGNQLLWIRGDPGKGKTMLLCGIVDELNKTGIKKRNIAYYFCQAANDKLNRATSVLRGLIFSLISQQRELLEAVRTDINEASGELFQDLNGWEALCRVFNRLMGEIERRRQTTYLIVDALDECLGDRNRLLKWIVDLSLSSIKVLVSSRNWPSIESGLSSATHKMMLHLELNADSISNAVDYYIDHKATELERSKGLDAESREVVHQHLKCKSDNTFLWVALVCQKLSHEETNPWEVLNMLREFPSGLDELYERMASQFLASRNAEICCQVLAVQVLACRPLNLAELLSLTKLPEKFVERWLRQVVQSCGSFLTLRDDTIYFVHQSAKDYLVEHMADSIFRQGLLAGHHTIFIQSIQSLSQVLQENIYQLPSLGSRIDSIKPPNPDPLNGIRYACLYWADHLVDAKAMREQDLEDGGLVHRFLENHLLHWLETLSLLKSLGLGIEALTKLSSLLRESKKGGKELDKLVYYALRFSRHHKIGIEAAPLQVYGSGLVFSPTHNVVRKLFQKKPEWLSMSSAGERNWSPCVQTLEGHKGVIWSVAFSPNGRHLVSGSGDSTSRIWDVVTGGCLSVLEGHRDGVYSVTFSPNGQCVASSSLDGDIRIWDVTTGACLRTLDSIISDNGFRDDVVALPDDKSVVLVNSSGRIRTWSIATGKQLRTVQIGHSAEDRLALCLSRGGRRAAWLSKGGRMVEVVDITAGKYHEEPWHRKMSDTWVSLALSSDGECVAIATADLNTQREIEVWNVTANRRIRTLCCCGVKTGPTSLALSPNHRYLAAAFLFDKPEWDIATGQSIPFTGELYFQRRKLMSLLEFSPDGELLVSVGTDEQICVWETSAARLQHRTLKIFDGAHTRKKHEIKRMTLSPDGKLLGFLGPNYDFQVWDTMNNRLLSTIVMKGNWPTVKFSPDSRHVACTWHPIGLWHAGGSIVELFDPVTGRRLWTSPGHDIDSTFFSADGKRLASAFLERSHGYIDGNMIQVLDAATGMCLSTFPVASPDSMTGSLAVALSAKGTNLATLSRRITYLSSEICIQTWDVITGSCTYSIAFPYNMPCKPIDLLFSSKGEYDHVVLTFSPDSRHIAYVGRHDIIWIVDVVTGALQKSLKGFWDRWPASTSIEWEPAGLVTHRGIYDTQALLNDARRSIEYGCDNIPMGALSGIGISLGKDWILKNGECYIWIPPESREFREDFPYYGESRNAIVFGGTTDQITCIRFP
ncbi:hypothetical protein F5Y10DRAFT_93453 [Nemania abortiva]|nr:hypothetical protein F5Y10DRAFT_93453 [Nemania abortiva]